jgi:hypothetical protein
MYESYNDNEMQTVFVLEYITPNGEMENSKATKGIIRSIS